MVSFPPLPRLLLSVALTSTAALAVPGALIAAETIRHYSIPAGRLDTALLMASHQSGETIVFSPDEPSGDHTAALEGDYTLDQLLARLLEGRGLEYVRDSDGAIQVRRAPVIARRSGDEVTLPQIDVREHRPEDHDLVARATPTTRTDAPLQLTPQSINVINHEIMRAQNANTLADALRNVSGVAVQPGSLGASSVNLRGYKASVLADGFSTSASSTPLEIPAIALESVEVLKGPSAILAGSGSPGGTVNAVHRLPQADGYHELRLGYGSFNERQLALDSTGALAANDRLSYRVIVDHKRSSRNAAGYEGKKELYFSPSLRWQDGDNDLVLRYTRILRTSPFSPYTVIYRDSPWTGPLPRPLGNREDRLEVQQSDFYYHYERRLGEHWRFVSKGSYTDARSDQFGWYSGTALGEDMIVWLNHFAQGSDNRLQRLENYFRGSHQWGDLTLDTVLGLSASRSRADTQTMSTYGDWVQVSILEPMPVLPSARSAYRTSFSESIPVGAFWQQNLGYGKWFLSAGLRFDSSWNGVFRRSDATQAQKRQVWSPSIGLLYEATPWLSLYGNHLKGYQPPSQRDKNGNLLPEQISQQSEAGLKLLLLDQSLSLTTAVYRIKFSNDAVYDWGQLGYVTTPGYVTHGFEIDVQGRLTPRLDLVGHYNYGDNAFASNDSLHAPLPKHHVSLWGRYRLAGAYLDGLSASLGFAYAGTGHLDSAKRYHLPAQLQTDLGIAWSRGVYDLNLTIKNLFDEDLFTSSLDGYTYFVPLQQPRTVLFTGGYRF